MARIGKEHAFSTVGSFSIVFSLFDGFCFFAIANFLFYKILPEFLNTIVDGNLAASQHSLKLQTIKFRLGTDQLLIDEQGESRISAEDYAIALLDEVERSQFVRHRMTVAY